MTIRVANQPKNSPVFLAPLAGITDLPFRDLVASFGAGLVVSEMVASQEMVQSKRGARERAELGFQRASTAVQLAGCEAYWMAEAARLVEANGASQIDINMGCPAKKVTGAGGAGASGSALMRDLDQALMLIEAVVSAVKIPVSLKTRLGWDSRSLNAPELARRAEGAGIQMITVHGRTRCQFYNGTADWQAISKVKQAIGIPVIANGDIIDTETAINALEVSGADGIMVGRGAQGRPWSLAQIGADVFGTPPPRKPVGSELVDMVVEHYEAMLTFYGPKLGGRVARKHLGWYMKDAGTAPEVRRRVQTSDDPKEVITLLQSALLVPQLQAAA